jgi:hypothetical protein
LQKKYHYHLAATQVVFVDPDDGRASDLNFNVMLRTDGPNLTAASIGRIQQNAQVLFYQNANHKNFKVVDVFIYNICPLGKQLEEDFQAKHEFTPEQEDEAEKTLKSLLGVNKSTSGAFD